MKTIQINHYEFKELSKEAQERAIEDARERNSQDIFWMDEIIESLKAVFEHCNGVSLKNWSIGAYDRCHLKIDFSEDAVAELRGKRAFAWFENNLFYKLRIPWRGEERKELRKYGKYYYAGIIKSCPFTGVCFDEEYLDAIKKGLKDGDSVGEILESLCYVARKQMENALDYQTSDEYIKEEFLNNDAMFLENGRRV